MFKTIERAADCEIRHVIHFLNSRNVLPSETHHQICQVYGDNVMINNTWTVTSRSLKRPTVNCTKT